jgi:hypothetical protein
MYLLVPSGRMIARVVANEVERRSAPTMHPRQGKNARGHESATATRPFRAVARDQGDEEP